MNKINLFRIIRRNQKIAEKRHPMFERNKAVKIITNIIAIFWAIYLCILGVLLAYGLKETNREAYDWVNGLFILFLMTDFFLRFIVQDTPAQEIKPYKLLPIPIKFLINTFLIRMGIRRYNMFWLFFFIPFGILTVYMRPYLSFYNFAGYIIGIWLMFVFNSYWYLFWRTLMHHHSVYILIPCCIYAVLIFYGIIHDDFLINASISFIDGFIYLNPICFIAVIGAIIAFFFINIPLQHKLIYQEIAKTERIKNLQPINLSILNHFGKVGEYLKLEIKSTIRNRIVRKQFIRGCVCMLLLCSIFSFTDVYDSGVMKTFICVYCFACLGVIIQTNIMCVEGNYMDGLMSRKESILSLLKAKYIFNCIMLIVPILFIITPLIKGKVTLMQILGCMFFTTGVIYPFIFQLAVYNNNSIHLNHKLTKNGVNTKAQMIVSMIALFIPMGIMYLLINIFDKDKAGAIMCSIGVIGTVISPLWLKNIYKRLMNRRYENMANFRKTK